MKRSIDVLSAVAALSAAVSALFGLFYSNGGNQRIIQNIYGQEVVLFGDGIYANDSLLKASATKGTDMAVILVCIAILFMITAFRNKKWRPHLQCGLLSIVLYASACLVMGVSFNRLFPLYLLQFSSAFFAFLLSFMQIVRSQGFHDTLYQKRLTGTGIFLIMAGCSVLVWLSFILPAVMTGRPMETIEIYTTEPTFVIDLAVILPASVFCGLSLLRKQPVGYKIAPVILTLLSGVGICVICQTIVQTSLGILLPPGQIIGLAGSFVLLGTVAAVLNARLLKYAE